MLAESVIAQIPHGETPWLTDDRASLVTWLAIAAHRSRFLETMLVELLASGRLSSAQERAVRRARARVVIVTLRADTEVIGKKARVE